MEDNKEIWKPVKGYEGLYEVSSMGRVKTFNYRGKKGCIAYLKHEGKRYQKVYLWKNGEKKFFWVHRLVAIAFHGEPTGERIYVNHINGDKQDNRVENLEWATAAENANNPATKPNYYIRYHKEGEFERRSRGQKRRFAEHPEYMEKVWAARWKRERL